MSVLSPFSTCNNQQFDFIAALDTSQIVARNLIHDENYQKRIPSSISWILKKIILKKKIGGSYLLSKSIYIYMSTFHLKI